MSRLPSPPPGMCWACYHTTGSELTLPSVRQLKRCLTSVTTFSVLDIAYISTITTWDENVAAKHDEATAPEPHHGLSCASYRVGWLLPERHRDGVHQRLIRNAPQCFLVYFRMATRRNPLLHGVTESDMATAVRDWLRYVALAAIQ